MVSADLKVKSGHPRPAKFKNNSVAGSDICGRNFQTTGLAGHLFCGTRDFGVISSIVEFLNRKTGFLGYKQEAALTVAGTYSADSYPEAEL